MGFFSKGKRKRETVAPFADDVRSGAAQGVREVAADSEAEESEGLAAPSDAELSERRVRRVSRLALRREAYLDPAAEDDLDLDHAAFLPDELADSQRIRRIYFKEEDGDDEAAFVPAYSAADAEEDDFSDEDFFSAFSAYQKAQTRAYDEEQGLIRRATGKTDFARLARAEHELERFRNTERLEVAPWAEELEEEMREEPATEADEADAFVAASTEAEASFEEEARASEDAPGSPPEEESAAAIKEDRSARVGAEERSSEVLGAQADGVSIGEAAESAGPTAEEERDDAEAETADEEKEKKKRKKKSLSLREKLKLRGRQLRQWTEQEAIPLRETAAKGREHEERTRRETEADFAEAEEKAELSPADTSAQCPPQEDAAEAVSSAVEPSDPGEKKEEAPVLLSESEPVSGDAELGGGGISFETEPFGASEAETSFESVSRDGEGTAGYNFFKIYTDEQPASVGTAAGEAAEAPALRRSSVKQDAGVRRPLISEESLTEGVQKSLVTASADEADLPSSGEDSVATLRANTFETAAESVPRGEVSTADETSEEEQERSTGEDDTVDLSSFGEEELRFLGLTPSSKIRLSELAALIEAAEQEAAEASASARPAEDVTELRDSSGRRETGEEGREEEDEAAETDEKYGAPAAGDTSDETAAEAEGEAAEAEDEESELPARAFRLKLKPHLERIRAWFRPGVERAESEEKSDESAPLRSLHLEHDEEGLAARNRERRSSPTPVFRYREQESERLRQRDMVNANFAKKRAKMKRPLDILELPESPVILLSDEEKELNPVRMQIPARLDIFKEGDSKSQVIYEILDWLKVICAALLIGLLLVNYVVQRNQVNGKSMVPTLENGDQLIVQKVSRYFALPHYGDIITFVHPDQARTKDNHLVKRVIGLPGDHIEIRDQHVFRNGEQLAEPYLDASVATARAERGFDDVTLGENQIYVLGDNRSVSSDSRFFGPVNRDRIEGTVVFRVYPFHSIGVPH